MLDMFDRSTWDAEKTGDIFLNLIDALKYDFIVQEFHWSIGIAEKEEFFENSSE